MIKRKYPQDTTARKIGTRGVQIAMSAFNAERWEPHLTTGLDAGVDLIFEYSNDNEFKNEKFYAKLKEHKN